METFECWIEQNQFCIIYLKKIFTRSILSVLVFYEDGRIGMQHIFGELYFHWKYFEVHKNASMKKNNQIRVSNILTFQHAQTS